LDAQSIGRLNSGWTPKVEKYHIKYIFQVTLLRDGIKLGYAFAGKNSTDLENKTLKMVSPRFLSVTPEQDPEHNETVRKIINF
jgi:hypothetical protein